MTQTMKADTTGTELPDSQIATDKLFDDDGKLVSASDLVENDDETTIKAEGQATLGDVMSSQADALRLTYRQTNTVKMVEDMTGDGISEYPLAGGPERHRDLISMSGEPCPECDSVHTSSEQRQMGAADEGMTGFHRCLDCGHNWRTGYGA